MKYLTLISIIFLALVQRGATQDLTIGMILYQKNMYAKALKHFKPLAKKGNAKAQFYLGLMYDNGQGVPQDYVKAFDWWHKSAKQAIAEGQFNLGYMYEHGKGVQQDDTKAIKWWQKAAKQGIAAAQNNLGVAYYDGHGVPQDLMLAYMWLRIATANDAKFAANNYNIVTGRLTKDELMKARALYSRCFQKLENCLDLNDRYRD